MLHPRSHLQSGRRLAWGQGRRPADQEPRRSRKKGFDTEGSLKKKGDSWFTGEKPNASYTAPVSVNTSKGPQTLTFMCVIHPWMHGSIEVLPGG